MEKKEKSKAKYQYPNVVDDDDDFTMEAEEEDPSFKSNNDKNVIDYSINIKLKEHEKPSLILYKYRWVVLAAFFFTSAATGSV